MPQRSELERLMKEAYSYENREGWGAEGLSTRLLGTVQRGERLYDLYVDMAGDYWYTVRVITDVGIVSEYEAIFGHREKLSGKRSGYRGKERAAG